MIRHWKNVFLVLCISAFVAASGQQASTANSSHQVVTPPWHALFLSWNPPATVKSGRFFEITVRFNNDGSKTWKPRPTNYGGGGYVYFAQTTRPVKFSFHYMRVTPQTVNPGEGVTWTVGLHAPGPGTYKLQYIMNRGSDANTFGEPTPAVYVTVTP